MDNRKVSLCITHYNRFDLLLECFVKVQHDDRISEIVIVDDCSTDGSWEKLQMLFGPIPGVVNHAKVKLYRNSHNLDCYANKREAVMHAREEWVILFDSDNVIGPDYLNRIFERKWKDNTVYCPDFAKPHFDYRAFSNQGFTKESVGNWMPVRMFNSCLNTCNYFINRQQYLRIWDGSVNPHTADSIFMMYNWLKAGNKIEVVAGLEYFHRIHEKSHFKLNKHKTGSFDRKVEAMLRALK